MLCNFLVFKYVESKYCVFNNHRQFFLKKNIFTNFIDLGRSEDQTKGNTRVTFSVKTETIYIYTYLGEVEVDHFALIHLTRLGVGKSRTDII